YSCPKWVQRDGRKPGCHPNAPTVLQVGCEPAAPHQPQFPPFHSATHPPCMSLDLSGVTIVFDLDGTLVDTAPDLAAAANHVFGLIGLAPVLPAELHPMIGRGSR